MRAMLPKLPSIHPYAILALQIAVWCVANNVYALHTHNLLRQPTQSPYLFLPLTFVQLVTGVLAAKALLHFSYSNSPVELLSSTPKDPATPQCNLRLIFLLAATAHFVATTLSNASYRAIGATATLVWKLVEPISTVVLKFLLLHQSTTFISLLGLHTVLAGVLLFSTHTLSLPALSPILIASFAYPLRNVLLKKSQPQHQPPSTPALFHRFVALSAPAAFAAAFLLVLVLVFYPPLSLSIPLFAILLNALLFNTYQLASLALLEKLDPLTHSLANTLKRFSAIFVAALYSSIPLQHTQLLGLAMTLLGFPLYILGPNLSARLVKRLPLPSSAPANPATSPPSSAVVLRALAFFLLAFIAACAALLALVAPARYLGTVLSLTHSHLDSLSSSSAVPRQPTVPSQLSRAPWTPVDSSLHQQLFVHIEPKYRVLPDPVLSSYADANHIDDGQNTGNFIWQHAAFVSLPDFSDCRTCNDSFTSCFDTLVQPNETRIVSYRPGANYFNPKRPLGFTDDINDMRVYNAIPLLIGIGVQARFHKDGRSPDLEPGAHIETTAADFEFSDSARTLLSLLQTREYPMLFRGDFTLQAASLAGYNHGVSTGCPTLFLNHRSRLGAHMQEKYDALRMRANDSSLRVAINVKEGKNFMRLVKAILQRYPNSYIYAQGRGDMVYLERCGIPFERVRLFANVEAWRDSLRGMELSIGARIHGNMLALAAEVPVYIIAPDHRVLEMARRMLVPHTTYFGRDVPGEDVDLASFVGSVGLDGQQFDRNRCAIAKSYRSMFSRFGFDAAPHVRAISEIC